MEFGLAGKGMTLNGGSIGNFQSSATHVSQPILKLPLLNLSSSKMKSNTPSRLMLMNLNSEIPTTPPESITEVQETFTGFKLSPSHNAEAREINNSQQRKIIQRNRKPKSMHRASVWTSEVENAYRFQAAGWRDEDEYAEAGYEVPEVWGEDFVRCLRVKKTGFFMYFRSTRECEDKHLNKIKIYEY